MEEDFSFGSDFADTAPPDVSGGGGDFGASIGDMLQSGSNALSEGWQAGQDALGEALTPAKAADVQTTQVEQQSNQQQASDAALTQADQTAPQSFLQGANMPGAMPSQAPVSFLQGSNVPGMAAASIAPPAPVQAPPPAPIQAANDYSAFAGAPQTPQAQTRAPDPFTSQTIDAALKAGGVSLPWYAPSGSTQKMAEFINANPSMSGADLVKAARGYGLPMNDQQAAQIAQHIDAARKPVSVAAASPFPAIPNTPAQPTAPPVGGEYPGRYGVPSGMKLDNDAAWNAYANRTIQVESNFNPNAVTGSYKGYGQWSSAELARHQAEGRLTNPADLQQNRDALIADGKARAAQLQQAGIPVTPGNVYLMHQQGEAGLKAHMSNPDAPAYVNEARAAGRSDAWGKQAIWGNMTADMRAKFPGGVDTVTSRDFVTAWNDRFNGSPGSTGNIAVASNAQPSAPRASAPTRVASNTAPPGNAPAPQGTQPQQPASVGDRMRSWLRTQAAEAKKAPPKPKDDSITPVQPVQMADLEPVSSVVRSGGKVYYKRYGRVYDTSGNPVG